MRLRFGRNTLLDRDVFRDIQNQAGQEFNNLSTVSTLLSSVTATTIQYNSSSSLHPGKNVYLANLLWIVSLIFSTGSAIQSQLAFYWLRHPRHQHSTMTPVIVSKAIRRAPIIFFVLSIISFAGGLIAYTYAAFAGSSLPSIAVACTAVILSMFVVSILWRVEDGLHIFRDEVGRVGVGVASHTADVLDPRKEHTRTAPRPSLLGVAGQGDLTPRLEDLEANRGCEYPSKASKGSC